MVTLQSKPSTASFSKTAFLYFQRGAAAFLLAVGLSYWAALIGLTMDGNGRFDLVPHSFQVVGPVLAVLFPIAATGLWFGVGWGFVLWLVGAAVQIGSQGRHPHSLDASSIVLTLHILGLGTYLAFWIYRVFIRRH